MSRFEWTCMCGRRRETRDREVPHCDCGLLMRREWNSFALQRVTSQGAGGTTVSPTIAKLDSNSAAATAVVSHYTTTLKATGVISFVNEHATQYLVHGFFAGCGLALAAAAGTKLGLIGSGK